MTTLDTDKVLQDVPYMRRYASLLCLGDRDRGDDLVEATLASLTATSSGLNGQDGYRLTLFRAMQKAVRDDPSMVPGHDELENPTTVISLDGKPDGFEADDLYRLLAQMPVEQRSILLLVVVEGLSHEDTAQVMGTSAPIVSALLADAKSYLKTETSPGQILQTA